MLEIVSKTVMLIWGLVGKSSFEFLVQRFYLKPSRDLLSQILDMTLQFTLEQPDGASFSDRFIYRKIHFEIRSPFGQNTKFQSSPCSLFRSI